ncbi:unnamed protein product [Meloidogyne enterolobii]|uniref:Uncharacterized protein n=1 Tax=Meloidogyne enterolobii TaxID=390850 RepID=A0ACB1A7E3_MELEN
MFHRYICLLVIISSSFSHGWELDKPFIGDFTYYDYKVYGACNMWINAETELLASISYKLWGPHADPIDYLLCRNICLKVQYKGRTIIVHVKDKCLSCPANKVNLSKRAFARLENLAVGHGYDAVFTFVLC